MFIESHVNKKEIYNDPSPYALIKYRHRDDTINPYLKKAMDLMAVNDAADMFKLTLKDVLDMDMQTYLDTKKYVRDHKKLEQRVKEELEAQNRKKELENNE